MHEEIIISGFGGQGVLFAGQMLAYAALAEGRQVTWIPSYGPEMRGGTAHCTVIISDDEIGSPLTNHPTVVLALNPPSLQAYASQVRPAGVLMVDATLVSQRSGRDDIHEFDVPAKTIATDLGFPQIANVVMLGALIEITQVVKLETVAQVLTEHVGVRHREALEPNKRALQRGAASVRALAST